MVRSTTLTQPDHQLARSFLAIDPLRMIQRLTVILHLPMSPNISVRGGKFSNWPHHHVLHSICDCFKIGKTVLPPWGPQSPENHPPPSNSNLDGKLMVLWPLRLLSEVFFLLELREEESLPKLPNFSESDPSDWLQNWLSKSPRFRNQGSPSKHDTIFYCLLMTDHFYPARRQLFPFQNNPILCVDNRLASRSASLFTNLWTCLKLTIQRLWRWIWIHWNPCINL